AAAVPTGVTARGGVLVGSASAPRHLVVFEDPQCPVCGQFERLSGPTLDRAVSAGLVQVEYRMRSFLGPESVRAVAALGAAAQLGRFEPLREQLFSHQPPERTGGYTVRDLLALGTAAGLTDPAWTRAVTSQTFAAWARTIDEQASRDGNVGTPELRLDGTTLGQQTVFDPVSLGRALGLP
ncbi:MAG: DsbA family protein, partial [Mycobacteriales bacterium]